MASLHDTYKTGIVVGSSRCLHAAQGDTLHTRHEAVLANQPVSIIRGFILDSLLDHNAESIGHMLVESTALAVVIKWGGVLSNSVLNRGQHHT